MMGRSRRWGISRMRSTNSSPVEAGKSLSTINVSYRAPVFRIFRALAAPTHESTCMSLLRKVACINRITASFSSTCTTRISARDFLSAVLLVLLGSEKRWRLRFRILERDFLRSGCRMLIIEIKLWWCLKPSKYEAFVTEPSASRRARSIKAFSDLFTSRLNEAHDSSFSSWPSTWSSIRPPFQAWVNICAQIIKRLLVVGSWDCRKSSAADW